MGNIACFCNPEDLSSSNQFLRGNPKAKNEIGGKRKLSKQGLPNIGNTCYLNTALQLIYTMKGLRIKIIDKTIQREKTHQDVNIKPEFSLHHQSYLYLMAKLFETMESEDLNSWTLKV